MFRTLKNLCITAIILVSFSSAFACPQDKNGIYWKEIGNYFVNTTFVNVRGVLCAGLDAEFKNVLRVHYSDNQGAVLDEPVSKFVNKDVVLISRSAFPRAANMIVRAAEPLTLRINQISSLNGVTFVSASMKFVRNMGKATGAIDIRQLPLMLKVVARNRSANSYYNNKLITDITIDTTGVLRRMSVGTIYLYNGDNLVESINPYSLVRVTRN